MEVGEAYINQTRKALIVRLNQPGKLSIQHYAISVSSLEKLLKGEKQAVPVLKVHD